MEQIAILCVGLALKGLFDVVMRDGLHITISIGKRPRH